MSAAGLNARHLGCWGLALMLLQAGCVPEIKERCRFVTEHVPTPALPRAFLPVDHLLIRRAICMTQEARGLEGVLARPFRIYFAEEALPILCGRLEEARQLALGGRAREAGRKYQALLLASQVFELAIAVHAFSEYADRAGVPSPKIMEMQDRFAEQIGPLLAAALSEDPAQIQQALSEHGTEYGAWTAALERWAAQVRGQEQRVRVARIVWDIGMLVVATYDAASTAADLAAAGRPPVPPVPALAGAGAGAAIVSPTALVDLTEALRQLIAAGAIDSGIVVALASALGGRGVPPVALPSTSLDSSLASPISPQAGGASGAASPVLRGDPYHPDSVEARIRPEYRPNPPHDPHSPLFNPRKTPEPPDAASVYQRATRANMGTWYGRGQQGWYRYFSDNAGGAHFSGIVPESQVPAAILRGP